MKLTRACEQAGKLPSSVITAWNGGASSRLGLLKKFVECGANFEALSIQLVIDKCRSFTLESVYEYKSRNQLLERYSAADVEQVIARCVQRGGVFTRPDPNLPTSSQYWVVTQTKGTAKELVEEHLRCFADANVDSETTAMQLMDFAQSGSGVVYFFL
jgi:hypothetical protein